MNPLSSLPLKESVSNTSMRFNTLDEWLAWQEGLHFTAIELGLDRCNLVAERMALLSPDFAVVSIAGTNGKGSSAAMLDLVLRNSGYNVASYTSPHLIRYNERIRIKGVEVDDEMLCQSFNRIDKARADISLTYFEFGTLAALDLFHQAGIELAIMEVGLGGRLDAVNILDADVALVCSIDLDHENWLGHDRNAIGYEKAGIFRARTPAVCSDPKPPQSIVDHAATIGTDLYTVGRDFTFEVFDDSWTWQTEQTTLTGLPKPNLNNVRQVQNAAGVLKVLDILSDRFPVNHEVINASLRDFSLSGRFQVIPGRVPFVLDVAHNREAAQGLAENLEKLSSAGKTHIVIGMLKDKNHHAVFQALSQAGDLWYVASLDSDRGAQSQVLLEELSQIVNTDQIDIFEAIIPALECARDQAEAGDRIVVTGSFLTVGAAIRWLNIEY